MKKVLFIIIISILSVVNQSFGQYGPMGFGNADGSESPAGFEQPRLLLWLDGSSVTVSNGQDVTVWPDKSGNGHDFISSAAFAPRFSATGGPSGTPSVDFFRANTRMYCENFPMSSAGYSIYFVIKTNDSKYGVFSFGSAAEPQELVIYNDDADGNIRQQMGTNNR
ncbi:MAG TPA: hypothetical protein VJ911_05430, partial [Cryomorphaceae bacterium]|nr:hypothetical protein [Cryomorphaceae bacterium]